MDATKVVVEAGAMNAPFPMEMQRSLAYEVSGEDDASTIVTTTPSQAGILTHHNQELHHMLLIVQHDVTTVRDHRNALQETVAQLVEHRIKLIEDLANQRIQVTTELDRRTTELTATNAVLTERARSLHEQVEQVERKIKMGINNYQAEHQVDVEHLHQDIALLTQRNDRLQTEHINTVVALKEQQCVSRSTQNSSARAVQAKTRSSRSTQDINRAPYFSLRCGTASHV